eukprot:comp9532_c0_seq1/m.4565 comp9532_c0_seq1/g.4565  ORF comp9532_c0_seq1/g.4565 comp9532_c0_seq1/m.4565 type:complete len:389 (-) comp9532_c0_seq1:654-1820(-)
MANSWRLTLLLVGASTAVVLLFVSFRKKRVHRARDRAHAATDLIGNTPMIELRQLSAQTGCRILAKCEFLNPGGSMKDRTALQIVIEAENEGLLKPGDTIYEGTAGSTGVSLAMIARARGYRCVIFMPDDQALEKVELLRTFGAGVQQVRPVSIVNRSHFVNLAKSAAEAHEAKAVGDQAGTRGFFSNQFENCANMRAHYLHTGREILDQTDGKVDAFVCAAGTGGTIAGVAKCLKEHIPSCKVYLIDPPGSSLYNKVMHGVLYTSEEAEGRRLRNPFDTITEGIGINRLTNNFKEAAIDKAFKGTDQEAVEMGHYLLRNEGLFVGSSSAMNCVGAVKVARELGPGHTIVTVLCDGGQRHMSKFFNKDYLQRYGLLPAHTGSDLSFVK